jgi:predicted HAD superfamily Cof-like phosphohydrolase
MKKIFEQVKEFNEAFKIPEQKEPSDRIPDEDRFLYYKLSKEENDEYFDAVAERNLIEVADALTDELYILIGKFRKHGFTFEQAEKLFNEVHASNMSKLNKDGEPVYRVDGKVLKGENYFKPNIKGAL